MKIFTYPDNYFDIAIIDPPYGIKEHGQRVNRKERWKNPAPVKYKKIDWDDEPPPMMFFSQLMRVSKNQIIFGANHFIQMIPSANSPCWIVWDKKTSGNLADCELAWTSFKTAIRKFDWLWSGFRKEQPEPRIHPTQKPVALYKWIMQTYCKPGDRILDTHLGSGSSAIAAHDMGFDFVGIELDPDYYAAAVKRFNNAKLQTKLF